MKQKVDIWEKYRKEEKKRMSEKSRKKRQWHTPTERIMMTGFGVVIILGTLLLCLPVSSASGKGVYWLDALFTATTSVCVTGLVTVPTATTWSVFGKNCDSGADSVWRTWNHGMYDHDISGFAKKNQPAESQTDSGYI